MSLSAKNPHLLRWAKLLLAAPKELEQLKAENLTAIRARERESRRYEGEIDQFQTIAEEETARRPLLARQKEELRTSHAVRLATETFLRTGVIDIDAIYAKVAPKA